MGRMPHRPARDRAWRSAVDEFTGVGSLSARGERVHVATVTAADIVPYRRAVELSRSRLSRWNPVNPDDLIRHLQGQSRSHRTFLVHALEPQGDHDIVGRINVTNVVRGRALSAMMGYDAYDPYAGRGLFAEGLRLVVDLAFAPEPAGMGLHRVEASVQPGNVRSAGLLRSVGFCRRGEWPDYLWLPDGSGAQAWRDHVTYGTTAAEWPARPYHSCVPAHPVVVVPVPSESSTTATAALARELGVPLVRADALHTLGVAAAASLLASARGAVVEDVPEAQQLLDILGWGVPIRLTTDEVSAMNNEPGEVVAVVLRAESQAHREQTRPEDSADLPG